MRFDAAIISRRSTTVRRRWKRKTQDGRELKKERSMGKNHYDKKISVRWQLMEDCLVLRKQPYKPY